MRVERFKMEREGLVTEGQEVEISERSAVTGQYTYLVEPSIAMSGIYRTRQLFHTLEDLFFCSLQ